MHSGPPVETVFWQTHSLACSKSPWKPIIILGTIPETLGAPHTFIISSCDSCLLKLAVKLPNLLKVDRYTLLFLIHLCIIKLSRYTTIEEKSYYSLFFYFWFMGFRLWCFMLRLLSEKKSITPNFIIYQCVGVGYKITLQHSHFMTQRHCAHQHRLLMF